MFDFYTPWKCQKIEGFPMSLRGIEMEHWNEIDLKLFYILNLSCRSTFSKENHLAHNAIIIFFK